MYKTLLVKKDSAPYPKNYAVRKVISTQLLSRDQSSDQKKRDTEFSIHLKPKRNRDALSLKSFFIIENCMVLPTAGALCI